MKKKKAYRGNLRNMDQALILFTFAATGCRTNKTSKFLGISESTVYRTVKNSTAQKVVFD